jgi:hypothetical protein
MPTYTFLNTETKEIEEHKIAMRDYDDFKVKNPHLQRHLTPDGAASFGDPVRLGITTTDGGFKEVLSKIAESNYRSNLSDKLSRR